MKRCLFILGLVVATPVWAEPTDQEVYDTCQQHLNITIGTSGRVLATPGYQPGWEACAEFTHTYQAGLLATAAAAKAKADAARAAREAEVKARLGR